MLEKKCTSCMAVLPISAFGKHKQCKDGIRSRCKKCEVKLNTAYRNTEHGKKVMAEYRSKESVRI